MFYWNSATHTLLLAAFKLQQQSWVVVTLYGIQNLKYLLSGLLQKKIANSCFLNFLKVYCINWHWSYTISRWFNLLCGYKSSWHFTSSERRKAVIQNVFWKAGTGSITIFTVYYATVWSLIFFSYLKMRCQFLWQWFSVFYKCICFFG